MIQLHMFWNVHFRTPEPRNVVLPCISYTNPMVIIMLRVGHLQKTNTQRKVIQLCGGNHVHAPPLISAPYDPLWDVSRCIVAFLREAWLFYLIWMIIYPAQPLFESVTNCRNSELELIPTPQPTPIPTHKHPPCAGHEFIPYSVSFHGPIFYHHANKMFHTTVTKMNIPWFKLLAVGWIYIRGIIRNNCTSSQSEGLAFAGEMVGCCISKFVFANKKVYVCSG